MSSPDPKPAAITPTSQPAKATIYLIFFQILGMLIPLLTLPILARALGVEVFGQLMLAQSLVFLGVLLLDAGFNTESQRLIALANNSIEKDQILLDNLIARTVCAIPVIFILLFIPLLIPAANWTLLLFSLPIILGTLLLPQWWLVAQYKGQILGMALTFGRVLSALTIVFLVRDAQDAKWAALANSSATLISGIVLIPFVLRPFLANLSQLNFATWRAYLKTVKVTIFSGFFSSASASIPVLLLSHGSGAFSTGIFSAADRLTRAAAYVLSFIEQTLMTRVVKKSQLNQDQSHQELKKLLQVLSFVLFLGALINFLIAPWVIEFLYGVHFKDSVIILKVLGFWLALYGVRKALLTFWWSAKGQLELVSRFQWAEAFLVPLFSALGVYVANAVGLAIALCLVEVVLILMMVSKRSIHF